MSALKPQLERIDPSIDPRNILAALLKLLSPYVPHSLSILGTILNSGPRPNTLQNVDPSKVSLWSTVPLRFDADSIINPPALFSMVTFSNIDRQFHFFCSAESSTRAPTEAEEMHVEQVFERLRDIAGEAYPTYAPFVFSIATGAIRRRIDTDSPMILIGAVHAKWRHVLAPMSAVQSPVVRYLFPRGTLARDSLRPEMSRWVAPRIPDDAEVDVEVSQIQTSDLPFVYGASTIPRSEAYVLSRVPYSVCLRSRPRGTDVTEGQPVACALLHSDGSTGGFCVDIKYQRQGLGRLVIHALAEKLDFSRDSDEHRDLGGGALGWNWVDTEEHNKVANHFFTSLGGEPWTCHWTHVHINLNL